MKKYVIVSDGLKGEYGSDGKYKTEHELFAIKILAVEQGATLTIISPGENVPDYTISLKDISNEIKELIRLGLL